MVPNDELSYERIISTPTFSDKAPSHTYELVQERWNANWAARVPEPTRTGGPTRAEFNVPEEDVSTI